MIYFLLKWWFGLLRILEVPEIIASALLLYNFRLPQDPACPNPATYFLTARSGYSLRFEKRLNPNIPLGPPSLRVNRYVVIDSLIHVYTLFKTAPGHSRLLALLVEVCVRILWDYVMQVSC